MSGNVVELQKTAADKADRDDIAAYGADYVYFCNKIKKLTSIDLSHYKGQQMHRRLESYRSRRNMPSFVALGESVQKNPGELKDLVDYLTINVSEFFRNPEQWKGLREKVLPTLRTGLRTSIKAWSAGSSSGQEAYTLAMILCEEGMYESKILGTDIDEPSLRKAQAGMYSRDEVAGIPVQTLVKYFNQESGGYKAGSYLKRMVTFEMRNLQADGYPTGFDLIMCRNVLIYFTDKGKNQVISRLANSLRPGGVLFTGATEAIFTPAIFGLSQIQPFFYKRMAG